MGFSKTSLPKELTKLKHKVCMMDAETVQIVLMLHNFFQDEKKVASWLTTKNPFFGDVAPLRIMQLGMAKKVIQFIEAAEHGRALSGDMNVVEDEEE